MGPAGRQGQEGLEETVNEGRRIVVKLLLDAGLKEPPVRVVIGSLATLSATLTPKTENIPKGLGAASRRFSGRIV